MVVFDIYALLGWIGVILILLAYALFTKKKLKINYVLYHLLNFVGAAGLIISTLMTESWPAFILALIVAGVSIWYIVKILSTKPAYKELKIE